MEEKLKPLREPSFFIMLSLSPGPNHGYVILIEVATLSGGRIQLSTGTLYGAIKRLLDLKLKKRVEDPSLVEDERGRKTYALTDKGRRLGGVNCGVVKIDWVYNTMLPKPQQIYPPIKVEPVTEF
jgi:DNA-binding MarR family transcriptional regulator